MMNFCFFSYLKNTPIARILQDNILQMTSAEVIHYRHFCRDNLSKLLMGSVEKMPPGESNSAMTDLTGWLSSLCKVISSIRNRSGNFQLCTTEQKNILHEVLIRQHGIHLRIVVNHFVIKAFKSSKKRESCYNEEIFLIKQFGFADIYKNDVEKLLNDEVESFIGKKLRGEYEEAVLPRVEEWVSSALIAFCKRIFNAQLGPYHISSVPATGSEQRLFQELQRGFLLESRVALARARAKELFDMVRDFPDSAPAVLELRQASLASGMMSFLGKTLKRALCGRLLHLGASTSDIIDVYVKMIRCFRILDPSNLLLTFVAKPIRQYLMGRKDTIRCIVSSLTEGDDDNLHRELRAGGSLEYGAGNDSEDEDEDEETPDISWNPTKRALDFPGGREGGQSKDVLALLVSIYGSTDLFVTEYRSVLAARLLQNIEYLSDSEVKTLELLKIRFGEEPLHSCEVMLHDIDSSKRLNTAIMAAMRAATAQADDCDADADAVVQYCVVSDEYWPSLHLDSTITHHTRAARLQARYSDTFDSIKKPKKLEIAPQLGQVFLELDFDDGSTREFSVSPTQATLILLLADCPGGSASLLFLAEKSDLAEGDVRKRMVYWVSRHVVREVAMLAPLLEDGSEEEKPGGLALGYEIIEDQAEEVAKGEAAGASSGHAEFEMSGNEDMDQNGISAEANESLALSSYEVYIRGMLQNQDGMMLERIHAMLKMVAGGGAGGGGGSGCVRYDLSIVQLRKFLQSLITADTLEIVDGLYKLRK